MTASDHLLPSTNGWFREAKLLHGRLKAPRSGNSSSQERL
jgi:hypothetical protein